MSEWIEWKGLKEDGKLWESYHGLDVPIPTGLNIEIRYRMGKVVKGVSGEATGYDEDGNLQNISGAYWVNDGMHYDIVAYRILNPVSMQALQEAGITSDTNFKDTNPKDAIGIRKAPLSVVPMTVIAEVGVGMLEGASKYGRHNYRGAGIRSSVYFDATMRHLVSWWEGEDIDPDSELSHVTKAICSLVVLRDAMIQGMATDDRPPRSPEFYKALNELAGKVIDKHADKNPHHYTIEDTERV